MTQHNKITGQFVAHRRVLLESPAWHAIGIRERKVLDRLELEHMAQNGGANGSLVVTKAQFQAFGIRRNAISEAIRVLAALGLLVVEGRGRAGNGEFRTPNRYRLTYLPTANRAPTDEWARISSPEDAKAAIKQARQKTDRPAPRWRPAPGPPLATVPGPPVGDCGGQATGPPVGDSSIDTLPGDLPGKARSGSDG